MSLNTAPSIVSAEDYARIFALERDVRYPMVDAYEDRLGYALDRERLEAAARVLSCPLKAAPPNWQHGRVIYATFRAYAERARPDAILTALDIGTAKGFSALCAYWGIRGAGRQARVSSVDVMAPDARVRRNTPAEVRGLCTLDEILAPWGESAFIVFEESTGIAWLKRHQARVHLAFVDGKHDGAVVAKEGQMLADRQQAGDVVIFDDLQVPSVGAAVAKLTAYDVERLEVLPGRRYGIGVRR